MIGVIANSREHAVVREFFELFKTPWEFHRSGRLYEVLLCTADEEFDDDGARVILIYAGHETPFDAREKIEILSHKCSGKLSYVGTRIPIYGDLITFQQQRAPLLVDEQSHKPVVYECQSSGATMVRVGYDLFAEIAQLLTDGQPTAHADIPTMELHIALLRHLIVASGAALVEVPPVPDGYQFIACLTHDVDHPSITPHKWDHTMFGFLYRAAFGSLSSFLRGQIPFRNLSENWAAVIKLLFVYVGLAKDFWSGFEDRYQQLESGLCSTYFVIPFKNRPGIDLDGPAPKLRAAQYGAEDIAEVIKKIQASSCEVGLHGIDAWLDSTSAREEVEEIRRLTGNTEIGVRMHWLYYDQNSPNILEQAGATYDSSVGYRETVGYRAGTTQAYKPLEANHLLELPMHVMDTALFYPAYMGLSQRQATTHLSHMVDNAIKFGGCITINWHDRSLAPERLWDASYRELVRELKNRGAWFATAGQATAWFRKRRSVVFNEVRIEAEGQGARVSAERRNDFAGLKVRIHRVRESCNVDALGSERYTDFAMDEYIDESIHAAQATE
jgi:hypothetical protein